MLSPYGKRECLTILIVGGILTLAAAAMHWWIAAGSLLLLTLALLAFFRDPHRRIPADRGAMVSPADGRVSSIHNLDCFEPFAGPAVCVRIFLSVLDVHVNRSPCHSQVVRIDHQPGQFLNALNPRSAEVNEATLMVLAHPASRRPVAAVRQVAGTIARRIVCAAAVGQVLQRGQRYGLIKFGSTTELYVPADPAPQLHVQPGQRVHGGSTILLTLPTTTD